jgi:hypothetical protein
MYCKIEEEQDKRLGEVFQRDTDGTLVFVSPHVRVLN